MSSIEKMLSELDNDYSQLKDDFEKYRILLASNTWSNPYKEELDKLLGKVMIFRNRIIYSRDFAEKLAHGTDLAGKLTSLTKTIIDKLESEKIVEKIPNTIFSDFLRWYTNPQEVGIYGIVTMLKKGLGYLMHVDWKNFKIMCEASEFAFDNLNVNLQELKAQLRLIDWESQPVIDFSVKEELIPLIQQEEFSLSTSQVLTILKYIRNSCISFEKTPRVYSRLTEPDLRDIILGNLNALFFNKATGETFNKRGDTDIHLSFSKGDILIMECKIWNGAVEYIKGLNQLFSYLTWRNNYAVIITFSKNKGCSDVVQNAKNAILNESTFLKNALKEYGQGEFSSVHLFPNDIGKKVEIHHLFFDLFYQEKASG